MTDNPENKSARAEKIKTHGVKYGKAGLKLAVQAGVLYTILTIIGFVLGGIGGYWLAAHYLQSTLVAIGASLLGMIAGSFTGFFLAQIVIIGIAQDILLDAGLKTGKTGLLAVLKRLNGTDKE